MTTQEVYENLLRDAVSIYSKEGLKEKLESGRRLKIKLDGTPVKDPTAALTDKGEYILSKGKNKFVKIVIS